MAKKKVESRIVIEDFDKFWRAEKGVIVPYYSGARWREFFMSADVLRKGCTYSGILLAEDIGNVFPLLRHSVRETQRIFSSRDTH